MVNPIITLSVTIGILILLGWVFWPDSGFFWRWRQTKQLTRRVLMEDALKHLNNYEIQQRRPTVASIAGTLHISPDQAANLLHDMQEHNLITFETESPQLTEAGRTYALQVIRAHRLWERYLADKTGYGEAEWHSQSERQEHLLTAGQTEALAAALGHPRFDPHGDPIPTADGKMVTPQHQPLTEFQAGQIGRIVHLEDEPQTVYAQLIAEGLSLGMVLRVTENTPTRVTFWTEGEEHVLAPVLANNISVVGLVETDLAVEPEHTQKLTALQPGESGTVVSISKAVRGSERRRLMDLGIIPGTVVRAQMVSPSGDPTAYQIRGALIGLRSEQARFINIK